MGLRAWLGLRSTPAVPAEPPAQVFALGWDAFPWWQQQAEGPGGRVTRDFALAVPAVLKARNIIVGTISSLPLKVLDAGNRTIRSPLLQQIDPDVANPVTMASLVEDVLFEAIGWLQVLGRDATGYPVWARRVDPSVVSAQPPPGTILADLPSGYVPGSTLWVGGVPTPARDMLRFDSPNPPLLEAAARAIRRAAKYEAAAEMYADSPAMRGYFTPADGSDPSQTEIDTALADWEIRRRQRADGYVPAGLKRVEVNVPTPSDLQLATLIDKATIGVANAFGVDPEDLGVSTTSRTYNNAVDRRQDKINETYGPIVEAIAARLSMADITRRGQRVIFGWDRYLEPNPTDRATIATAYLDAKVLTADEVRMGDLDRPALTAAQREELHPAPLPADTPGQPAEDEGVVATVTSITARSGRAAATFSADPGLVFAADVIGSVQVDVARRTITGLVVPWGEIGRSNGQRWRFAAGSLVYDPNQLSRNKMLVDHEFRQSVGHLVHTWSDRVGQWATYKIARGPAGDKALAEADDGAKDGLSVGVGFAGDDPDLVAVEDPENPGVILVLSAPWRETSLVALPAFVSARTTAVRMAAYPNGAPMQCNHCGQVHAPGIACPTVPVNNGPQQGQYAPNQPHAAFQGAPNGFGQPQHQPQHQPAPQGQGQPQGQQSPAGPSYTLEQAAGMFAAMQSMQGQQQGQGGNQPQHQPRGGEGQGQGAGQTAATYTPEQLTGMFAAMQAAHPQPQPEQPANVNPLARPLPGSPAAQQGHAPAQVTEAPLYRFDGNKGQRSFVSDIANGFGGDAELRKKAGAFIADQMRMAFANITTTNVGSLNPSIQRPDLYVGRLAFTRPIGGMVTGGVVTEITKSVLPKFNAATGLAGEHTQGTEPTEGALSTTSQEVTPKAISGRLNVNREVIDQGGTPQTDQVMWDAMTQFYAELLEVRLVDALQALSLSDTAIVGVDDVLQADILGTWSDLQFIRGGDRYTGLALDAGLYKAITGAVDADGRPLFPLESPVNASGQTASDLSSVRVAGKRGVPAWGLTTANGGPDKSFLLVPSSVYQWFSPPQRIDLDRIAVSYVGIGIWGYSAEFVSRDSDVMQLAYAAA